MRYLLFTIIVHLVFVSVSFAHPEYDKHQPGAAADHDNNICFHTRVCRTDSEWQQGWYDSQPNIVQQRHWDGGAGMENNHSNRNTRVRGTAREIMSFMADTARSNREREAYRRAALELHCRRRSKFRDNNGNGVHDPGEPYIHSPGCRQFGRR